MAASPGGRAATPVPQSSAPANTITSGHVTSAIQTASTTGTGTLGDVAQHERERSGARGQSHLTAATPTTVAPSMSRMSAKLLCAVGAERSQHHQKRHEQDCAHMPSAARTGSGTGNDTDTAMMFDSTITHTIAYVTFRFVVSIAGPGTSP